MPSEFGDMVVVRFPFTNQAAFKQRPAVVVSSQGYSSVKPEMLADFKSPEMRHHNGDGNKVVVSPEPQVQAQVDADKYATTASKQKPRTEWGLPR